MSDMLGESYFGASNGAGGFVNYFGNIFCRESCKRIYVIKGGPGTGKSRLMNEVAAEAESRGLGVRRYYCSSDPSSLDGIIIDRLGVGMLDGTAPHCFEPSLVGAFEQMIDLGVFWNERVLYENRAEIELLVKKKRDAYKRAYTYLSSYGELLRAEEAELVECIDRKKLSAAVKRLLHGAKTSEEPCASVGLCRAVGMDGFVKLDTYENMKGAVFCLPNRFGLAYTVLDEIKRRADLMGISYTVSYHPVLPERVDAIALKDTPLVFVIGEKGERTLNPMRFVKEDSLKPKKEKLRRIESAAKSVEALALDALQEVKEYHFALEDIYAAAMDFCQKEKFCATFIKKLFKS